MSLSLLSFYRFLLSRRSAPIVLRSILKYRLKKKWESLASYYEKQALPLPSEFEQSEEWVSARKGDAPIIWLHAVSVGEVASLKSLVMRLLKTSELQSYEFLLSFSTEGAYHLASSWGEERLHRVYMPLDCSSWVARFLDHWNPEAVLWCEQDLWPHFFKALSDRHIPWFLVSARFSQRALSQWEKAGKKGQVLPELLSQSSGIWCQEQEVVDYFKKKFSALKNDSQFPIPLVRLGNLKLSAHPVLVQDSCKSLLESALGERELLWMLASSHSGEEEVALWTLKHQQDAKKVRAFLFLAPRNLERIEEVEALLKSQQLPYIRWSALGQKDVALELKKASVLLVDSMGVLGTLFSLQPITLMGGSLVSWGGHNPWEPALSGSFVLMGPSYRNFDSMSKELHQAGCLRFLETPLRPLLPPWSQHEERTESEKNWIQEVALILERALDQALIDKSQKASSLAPVFLEQAQRRENALLDEVLFCLLKSLNPSKIKATVPGHKGSS